MAIFSVVRAGRDMDGYMEDLIMKMCYDPRALCKLGYGILCEKPEEIINSFNAVRSTYCKMNAIRVHCMEVFIEYDVPREKVLTIANEIGKYFFLYGFQNYISVIDTDMGYRIIIIVNSVAYSTGYLFFDNNLTYEDIWGFLAKIIPLNVQMRFAENVFFNPEIRSGNYEHGTYA